MTMTTGWTEARVADLRRLWAEGFSASRIANQLGTTKNAIIGKVDRLGLSCRVGPRRAPVLTGVWKWPRTGTGTRLLPTAPLGRLWFLILAQKPRAGDRYRSALSEITQRRSAT